MSKNLRVSMRVEEEIGKKLNALATRKKLSKGDLLGEMISLYEQKEARENRSGRSEKLDRLEKCLQALKEYHQYSLQHAGTARKSASEKPSDDKTALQRTIFGQLIKLVEKESLIVSLRGEVDRLQKKLAETAGGGPTEKKGGGSESTDSDAVKDDVGSFTFKARDGKRYAQKYLF